MLLRRTENDHQRLVALIPSVSRSHDADHILSYGVRFVRTSSIHGRIEEQMRQDQNERRELASVRHSNAYY